MRRREKKREGEFDKKKKSKIQARPDAEVSADRTVKARARPAAMAPPPAKKRRVATVAVVSRRTTRSQKPRLSAELLGKVASYSSLGEDLLNICIVAGPRDCAAIRHAYLRKNINYLQHALVEYVEKECNDWKLCRDRYLAWMEINADWRELVTKGRMESLSKVFRESDGREKMVPDISPFVPFNNPAVAIELGLLEPLKHLVNKMKIDVNAYKWTTYRHGIVHPGYEDSAICLLATTIDYMEFDMFLYLLSKEGIDVCSLISSIDLNDDDEYEATVLEHCFVRSHCHAFFRKLASHPTCNLERGFSTTVGNVKTYVHSAICFLVVLAEEDALHFPTWVANLRLLLSLGADPMAQDSSGQNAIQFASSLLERVAVGSQKKTLKDAMAILEGWVANNNN